MRCRSRISTAFGSGLDGLTGPWLGRFAPERFRWSGRSPTPGKRIGDQASWRNAGAGRTSEGMAVVAAGAADRWFTHAFRQKAPEVVEALCHQLTHTDAAVPPAVAALAADLRGEVVDPAMTLIIAGESDPVTTVGARLFSAAADPLYAFQRWWFWRHRICPTLRRRKHFGAAELFPGGTP